MLHTLIILLVFYIKNVHVQEIKTNQKVKIKYFEAQYNSEQMLGFHNKSIL